jgi:hypothetical protein
VDHFPRPPVRKKKRWRDRLIRVADRHPEWAVGFLDEHSTTPGHTQRPEVKTVDCPPALRKGMRA